MLLDVLYTFQNVFIVKFNETEPLRGESEKLKKDMLGRRATTGPDGSRMGNVMTTTMLKFVFECR
jgi:hypothetical protein